MKASIKFREEQKPLFKAKVPLSILGLPFQSSLLAGDTKELSLGLSTFFESGPSFRVSYQPNDPFKPFSLVIKSGIGHFGSPIDAPMSMSAECNFFTGPNNGFVDATSSINPRFMLHFKPSFGDFSIKKSQSSVISDFTKLSPKPGPGFGSELVVDSVAVDKDIINNNNGDQEDNFGYKMTTLPLKRSVESALTGMEIGAKTVLPVRNGAVLKMRWGVKFPEGFRDMFVGPAGTRMLTRGVPLLVLNKIGIEHVAKDNKRKEIVGPTSGVEIAEACFGVKKQLEALRAENGVLGRALEDLKAEFAKGRGRSGGDRKAVAAAVSEGEVDGVAEMIKA